MKNEAYLFNLAKQYNIDATKTKFDKMIESASADYQGFLAKTDNLLPFELEVMINFYELFEHMLDLKKKPPTLPLLPQAPAKSTTRDKGKQAQRAAAIAAAAADN